MFFLKINFHNSASWFFIFLHHFIRRFLLTSDTVRVCLTLCLLIPWEWSLIGIVLTENVLELVVWNYLQFDSQFAVFLTVWFKILSPLSLMILFLPPLERFFILPPSLYFFNKPRNYWLIHRKNISTNLQMYMVFHLVYIQIYSLSSLLLWQFLSSTLHCSQRQKWRVYSNGN